MSHGHAMNDNNLGNQDAFHQEREKKTFFFLLVSVPMHYMPHITS